MSALWHDVKPRKLRASRAANQWVFAEYLETPSQREDGNWFRAFLFRDTERKVFGALIYTGKHLANSDARDWAGKIVADAEFRKKHIITDKELIALWKRR